jgi:hypothetical protein
MILRRIIASLLLALVATAPAAAQTALLINPDTTDFDLVARSAAQATVELRVPVRPNLPGAEIRRWSITQVGRIVSPAGSKLEFQGSAAQQQLAITLNLINLNVSGPYVLTAEFAAPSPPPDSSAAPQKPTDPPPAPKPPLEQTIQFKLNKPAAELRISTPLQLSHTMYHPWHSTLEPSKFSLNESGGKSWVKIDPASWSVELRRGSEPAEAGRLAVELPPSVDGWGQADAKLSLSGLVSIGTATGTLTVRAAQLASQSAEFAVTIVTRISPLWVLLMILIGIVLGVYFRGSLVEHRARLEAAIPAEQEIGRLDATRKKTPDPEFAAKLAAARKALAEVIDTPASTAEAIRTATADAAKKREDIVKTLGELTNTLRAELDTWRRIAAMNEPLPASVGPEQERLRAVAEDLTGKLELEGLASVVRDKKGTLSERGEKLRDAIEDWLTNVESLKAPVKPWPNAPLADALRDINSEAAKLKQTLDAANTAASADATWKLLAESAHLVRSMQARLSRRALGRIKVIGRAIGAALLARDAALRPQADAIEHAIETFDQFDATNVLAPERLVPALDALHAAIESGISAAWNDPATQPKLDDGNFIEALEALEKRPKPGAPATPGVMPAAPAAERLRAALATVVEAATREPPVQWKLELEASEATVSDPVRVQVHVTVPDGRAAPALTLRWFEGADLIAVTEPGTLEHVFTFSQPGPAQVSVAAEDKASGASVRATLIIQVQALHGARVIAALEADYERTVCLENLISGAIILVAGWLIFSPTFVGSLPEFFAAFLWGFSVDIGAAKVRELTDSVKALKPTIPIPKT